MQQCVGSPHVFLLKVGKTHGLDLSILPAQSTESFRYVVGQIGEDAVYARVLFSHRFPSMLVEIAHTSTEFTWLGRSGQQASVGSVIRRD